MQIVWPMEDVSKFNLLGMTKQDDDDWSCLLPVLFCCRSSCLTPLLFAFETEGEGRFNMNLVQNYPDGSLIAW